MKSDDGAERMEEKVKRVCLQSITKRQNQKAKGNRGGVLYKLKQFPSLILFQCRTSTYGERERAIHNFCELFSKRKKKHDADTNFMFSHIFVNVYEGENI